MPAQPDSKSDSFWPADWSQLISGLVATFFGALLALWTAIALDRRSQRRERQREQLSSTEQMNEKLDLLARELSWNGEELAAILGDLETGFRTDRAPLTDAWNAVGIDAMKAGGPTATRLSEAYSLLRRCQRVLDAYARDLAQGGQSAAMAREQTLPRLRAVMGETQAAVVRASAAVQENRPPRT